MIPFGPVYRELRSLMLAVFPEDMAAPGHKGVNFSQWIELGTYLVSNHDAKSVCLIASPHDLAVALARDVELLVDSCFEQLFEILTHSASTARSPSWGVVTCYYYGFYAVQALSRILGHPITYLDDTRVSTISKISSVPLKLGAGSFAVSKTRDLSATQSEFKFSKSKLRPHDAVWKSVLQRLSDLRTVHKPSPSSSDLAAAQEFQLFDTIASSRPFRAFQNGGFNWPAEVRYEANYRVGNAYTMLRDPWHLKPDDSMKGWDNITNESILALVRTSLAGFRFDDNIQGLKSRVQFMLHAANTVFALVRRLQGDLNGRRRTDARWEERRKRFCHKHSNVFERKESWLFPNERW